LKKTKAEGYGNSNRQKTTTFDLTLTVPNCSALARLVAEWENLPEHVRKTISTLIEAHRGSG
jgi:hypothetical protein